MAGSRNWKWREHLLTHAEVPLMLAASVTPKASPTRGWSALNGNLNFSRSDSSNKLRVGPLTYSALRAVSTFSTVLAYVSGSSILGE